MIQVYIFFPDYFPPALMLYITFSFNFPLQFRVVVIIALLKWRKLKFRGLDWPVGQIVSKPEHEPRSN